MSNYYRGDCERWARRFVNSHPGAVLVKIEAVGGPVLGQVLVPDGSWETLNWHYHFAALYSGRVFDEAYPRGISPREFLLRFQYPDAIKFTPRIC